MASGHETEAETIWKLLETYFQPRGFESHPFLIGWYNERVGDKFKVQFADNTLAFVVLSQPSMFEKTFVPFLTDTETETEFARDPLDMCMIQQFDAARALFPGWPVTSMHDFEVGPSRRPRVLVQTAAHVSGAVRFFRPGEVDNQDLLKTIDSEKVYPVCLHPRFGGWFAIRGVLVFESVLADNLPRKEAQLALSSETVVELLKRYNDHWQDWSFRDVIPAEEKYSDFQKAYFGAKPGTRMTVVQSFCQHHEPH